MLKPQAFAGDRGQRSDWFFTFRAYVGAINGRMKLLMDHAQASHAPLSQATDVNDQTLDEQFYFVIVMLVKGIAL